MFQAWMLIEEQGEVKLLKNNCEEKELLPGEVRVQVQYSGINYKDRLACDPKSRVVRNFPMVPGIDFSGIVKESADPRFQPGEAVFLTGFGYGTDRFGGYQEQVVAKAEHLLKLPEGMTLREAMIYGTAGLTAAMSVDVLSRGLGSLKEKSILVTGGTGGVALHSILLLNTLGAQVTAATRDLKREGLLRALGAKDVILFDTLAEKKKPLAKERWHGVVDATGGSALGEMLKEVSYGGVVAASGNLSGISFESTVFPFILRGVTLQGVDSVSVPLDKRQELFLRLSKEWKSEKLEHFPVEEISFAQLGEALGQGQRKPGRTLVHLR